MTAYGYHDDEVRRTSVNSKRGSKPSKEQLQEIKEKEYKESRSVTLKDEGHSQDESKARSHTEEVKGGRSYTMTDEEIQKKIDQKADEILGAFSHLFQSRSLSKNSKFDNRGFEPRLPTAEEEKVEGLEEEVKKDIVKVLIKKELGMKDEEIKREMNNIKREVEILELIKEVQKYIDEKK